MTDKANFALDGISARTTSRKSGVVLFDRQSSSGNNDQSKPSSSSVNSLDGVSVANSSAKMQSKLRTNQAKQRGWEIVAQARLDAKHQPRHKQRLAAQRAAHHHRQRHDINNYARVHTTELELDETQAKLDGHINAHKVSFWLKLQNTLKSRSFKLSAAGVSAVALLVVGASVLVQQPSVATPVTTGQVHSASTESTQSAPVTNSVPETNQSTTDDDDDGNLELWSP